MRSAIEFYNVSFNRLKFSSRLIGAGLFEKKYGFTFGRIASLTQIVLFLAFHAWTGYIHRQNALEILESQSLICTGIALMIKYFTMIRNRDPVRELTGIVESEMYMKYQETCNEYPVLWKYGRLLYFAGQIMIGGYYAPLFIIWIYPLFVYFTEGRVLLLFSCEIPYVDWTMTSGYWITIALQLAFYVTGVCGLILVDYLCAYFTINGSLYVDILRFHLDEMSELLADPVYQMRSSPDLVEKGNRKWRQCLMEHQHIVEFFEKFSDLWSMINLAQVGCSVFGICINMLIIFLTGWYAAYAILFALFIDLSVHFVLGAIIERKVDDLHISLMLFPWYLLDVRRQKEYQLLLLRAQQPCGMSIAGLTPVNYETYTQIMKMLYQLFAIAMNFLK
ncbi:uncharacterized protein LOC125775036 isoform X2 [Anopheles funestus]|uniref:uncharacterized protein LOC125775036 isoform X2 n=1 Tax=Anopheles funestus TaxID=62324 RepID=UPI0020C5F139|nr:uncharacterized protein LOC125775036 isoform X2 [Anopheles funestus]